MAKGKLKRIQLTCPMCGRFGFAVLMENSQGMYKVNTYLCATDLTEMVRTSHADRKQGGDNEAVG